MKITVSVTTTHIAAGACGSITRNPLSLAIADSVPGLAGDVEVYPVSRMVTTWLAGEIRVDGELPWDAAELARRFHRSLPVEALQFELVLEAAQS
jgi:hypothetical protein